MACATGGLAVGLSVRPAAEALRPSQLQPIASAPLPEGSTILPQRSYNRLCRDVHVEIEEVREEQKRLEMRIRQKSVGRVTRSRRQQWPDNVQESLMPLSFEDTILDLGEELQIAVDEVNCEDYPCFAVLANETSEESFNKLREGLDAQCGASLMHYGAVNFGDDGHASYAVACVPSAKTEDVEDLKSALRERVFARLGEKAGDAHQ